MLLLLLLLLLTWVTGTICTSGAAVIITSGPAAAATNETLPVPVSGAHSISNPTIVQDDESLLGENTREPVYANDPPLPQLVHDERGQTHGKTLFGARYNDPFELLQLNTNLPLQLAANSKVIGRVTSVWARRVIRGSVRRVVRYDKLLCVSSLMLTIRMHCLAVANMFRVFSFKGVGLSFVKSAVKWNSFGFGFRVPVTPHFPEYDRLLHLPRISTFAGISYPLDYRFSVSASFPLHVVTDALSMLASDLRLASTSWIDSLSSKATDSVKRVGLTLTFRYNPVHRLRIGIGPWWFFLPGQRTMEAVLPALFFLPALLLALLNLFVALDPRLFFFDAADEIYSEGGEVVLAASPPMTSLDSAAGDTSDCTEDCDEGAGDMPARLKGAEAEEASNIRCGGLSFWHNELLRWAATKVCGLGYNIGWYRSSDNDRYVGSSVLFDIQPFFFRKLRRSLRDVAPTVGELFGSRVKAKRKKKVKVKVLT